MEYPVINKETFELKTLTHEDVNDMDFDIEGRVVVYGTDGAAYYLFTDSEMLVG